MRDILRSTFSFVLVFPLIIIAVNIPFPGGSAEGRFVGNVPAEGFLAALIIYFFLLGLFEIKVPHELPERFL